jgi:polyphosphate kinase 2
MGLLIESHRFKELSQKTKESINEGFFKDLLNSLFGNESESKLEQTENLGEITDLLEFNGVLNSEVSDLLDIIVNHPNVDEINFGILGRTMSNVLLKKGDKISNIKKYLNRIIKSLNSRDVVDDSPEEEYMDIEGEKSEISRKQFQKEKTALQIELLKMQEWLKESGSSVIILFEGRDTAGKGSTINKFTEYLDPKFYKVVVKDIPTEEERKNWFARYEGDIEPGKIIFFDRSWYNRGIVEPVMGYSSYDEYEEFMANVNGFEKGLVDAGNYLIKFWFSITKDTQAKRFDLRKGSPLKYWKYSPNDAKAQEKWEEYTNYKKRVFKVTSTPYAPWTIIDANDKRISGLNAMRYVLNQVPYEGKDEKVISMKYPEVVTTIR